MKTLEQDRQKQMHRLIARYATMINVPGTWILPYSWNIGYVDLADPAELHYTEYFCNTNNLIFAAMIFEADMLPMKIQIASMDFNSLVLHPK